MAYFQKTIVRYERDPRAAEDADFYKKEIIEAVENFDFDER